MRSSALLTICAALLLVVAISLSTIASDNLNYQGRLTNASGTAVPDASYSLTFRIYNVASGGSALWTETHSAVVTSGGLFTVLLGSIAPLDLASLGTGNLYLEIQVGASLPLSPRTLLTTSSRAAVAGRISGDIATAQGSLVVTRNQSDSSITLRTLDDRSSIRLFDPQPEPPGRPIMDLSSSVGSGAQIKLFDPQPEPPGYESILMSSGVGTGPSLILFDPQPEPPGKLLEVAANRTSGSSIRMFDPQPEPPGKLFELTASSASGPSMSFFNQAGQVMGIEPVPWNTGFSIKLFDPQPEPPGKMLEIGTSYSASGGAATAAAGTGDTAWLKTYGPSTLGGLQEFINLYSTDTDAEIRLGQGAPLGSSSSYFSAKSNGLESKVTLVGPTGASPAPPIVLTSMGGVARLGIGTPTPTQALQVIGNICYTGTIGACSDGRYKKDIEPVAHALDMVSELEGVRYQWKTDEYPDQQFTEEKQIGFVAQEVKRVLPEVVMEQPDGSLAIDYGRLTPVLLEAIKELKKQNEELSKRVQLLEERSR